MYEYLGMKADRFHRFDDQEIKNRPCGGKSSRVRDGDNREDPVEYLRKQYTFPASRSRPQNIEANFRRLPVELQEMIFTLAHDADNLALAHNALKWLLLGQRFPMACRKFRAPVEMVTVECPQATIVCPMTFAHRVPRPYRRTPMFTWGYKTPRRDVLVVYRYGCSYKLNAGSSWSDMRTARLCAHLLRR